MSPQPATVMGRVASVTLIRSYTGPQVTVVTAETVPKTRTVQTVSAVLTTTIGTGMATVVCPVVATLSVSRVM